MIKMNNDISYLKSTAEGKMFIDMYDESMNTQNYFTATPKQFNNSNYQPNSTVGLEDNSYMFLPTIKIAPNVINTTVLIGKATTKKADEIILNTGIKVDNTIQNSIIPAVKDGYYKTVNIVTDPENIVKATGAAEIVNDVLNDSTPASSPYGQAINTARGISDIIEEKLKDE